MTMPEVPAGTQALLFDCDGTMVDTMGVYRLGWDEVFARYGFDVTDEWFATWGGHSTAPFVRAALPDADEELVRQVSREGHDAFLSNIHRVEAFEAVVDVARAHHRLLPMAIVSGGPRRAVVASLESVGIDHLFDLVVTVDDVAQGKPAPDAYVHAMDLLGVDPSWCVAYEDSASGIASARDAGIAHVVDVRLHRD